MSRTLVIALETVSLDDAKCIPHVSGIKIWVRERTGYLKRMKPTWLFTRMEPVIISCGGTYEQGRDL